MQTNYNNSINAPKVITVNLKVFGNHKTIILIKELNYNLVISRKYIYLPIDNSRKFTVREEIDFTKLLPDRYKELKAADDG